MSPTRIVRTTSIKRAAKTGKADGFFQQHPLHPRIDCSGREQALRFGADNRNLLVLYWNATVGWKLGKRLWVSMVA